MKRWIGLASLLALNGRALAEEAGGSAFAVPVGWFVGVLAVAAIVAFIVTESMKAKLQTAAHREEASDYIREDSFTLDVNEDIFLYETVERRRIEKDEEKK